MPELYDPAYEQRGKFWYRVGSRCNGYEPKECAGCGETRLVKRGGRFCSNACGRRRGADLGYFGAHQRVSRVRAKAIEHPCIDCSKAAAHWSQIHGTTGQEPEHYEPRCVPCHRTYDGVPHGEHHGMSKVTEDAVREMRRLFDSERDKPRYGRTWTLTALGERFNISYTNVSLIVRRKAWKHVSP